MKRDLDLYRDQLLQIEQLADGTDGDLTLDSKGISHRVFQEHLRLLKEGGLIDADEIPDTEDGSTHYVPIRLTWQGHEFLDTIRDPEIWRKTKDRAKSVVSISVGFLWEIAKAEMKAKLGLP